MITHNGTNDSDKISLLFPFEKTHPNTPEKKGPQAPSIFSSRKISVYLKNKDKKNQWKLYFAFLVLVGQIK